MNRQQVREAVEAMAPDVLPELSRMSDTAWGEYKALVRLYKSGRYTDSWLDVVETSMKRFVSERLAFSLAVIRDKV